MAAISLNLPPGFRFSPTEVELIDYYLRSKITGINEEVLSFIREVQFFKREPWDLPGLSGLKTTDLEWCFFSPQDLKNPNGKRLNRKTNDGYWKVTGKDQEIWSGESLIGIKKILVFYETSSGNCKKTDWVMHEYHTTLKELDGTNPGQKTYVLCRLFDKQKQNSGKAGPAKSKLALASESPALEDHPTTNESLHSENSDGIMKYDTIATSESPDNGSNGRKRKYSGKAGPAKSKRSAVSVSPALEKQAEDHTTTNECLRSQNSDTIASVDCSDSYSNAYAADNLVEEMTQVIADEVDQQLETNPLTPITSLSNAATDSSPNIAKSSPEEAKSDLTQASSSVSPALVQAEDYPRIDGNTSDTRAPVECGDNTFNAYAAQNLVSDTEFDLQVQQYIKDLSDWMQNPLDCNPSTPITSLWDTTKSSPEEAESDLTQASVSPAPGGEADNHVTRCNPTKTFDVTKSNTIAFTECNHFSDNADTTKNQVAEVVDSNMSCVPPLELLKYYSILRSPLHSQMQYELVPHCNSDSLTNDVVTSQYGTNEAATYNSLWGLMPNSPYKFPHNDPRSHYDSKLFPIGSRL